MAYPQTGVAPLPYANTFQACDATQAGELDAEGETEDEGERTTRKEVHDRAYAELSHALRQKSDAFRQGWRGASAAIQTSYPEFSEVDVFTSYQGSANGNNGAKAFLRQPNWIPQPSEGQIVPLPAKMILTLVPNKIIHPDSLEAEEAEDSAHARVLYESFTNFDAIMDSTGGSNKVNKLVQHRYEPEHLAACSYKALHKAKNLHSHGSHLPPMADPTMELVSQCSNQPGNLTVDGRSIYRAKKKAPESRNLGFTERWLDLCLAAQYSKAVATDILDLEKMDRVIIAPGAALGTKRDNAKNNEVKGKQLKKAKEADERSAQHRPTPSPSSMQSRFVAYEEDQEDNQEDFTSPVTPTPASRGQPKRQSSMMSGGYSGLQQTQPFKRVRGYSNTQTPIPPPAFSIPTPAFVMPAQQQNIEYLPQSMQTPMIPALQPQPAVHHRYAQQVSNDPNVQPMTMLNMAGRLNPGPELQEYLNQLRLGNMSSDNLMMRFWQLHRQQQARMGGNNPGGYGNTPTGFNNGNQ